MQRIFSLIESSIAERCQHLKVAVVYIVIMPNKEVKIVGAMRFRHQEAERKLLASFPVRVRHFFVDDRGFACRTASHHTEKQGDKEWAK